MTKIDIFSGFLGAGKTTLIKKLIAEAYQGEKIVLIENEFGEIAIDGGFLKDAGVEITEMNSGCICCTLVGDFTKALKKVMEDYAPDRIIIEPSGVGKLSDVAKAVSGVEGAEIGAKVTVVDAGKCRMYMRNFGEFFNDQVENADLIVMSRTDTASAEKILAATELLKGLNDHAGLITTPWSQISGLQIREAMDKNGLQAEMERLAHEHEHHHDHEHEHEHEHHHDHDHEHEHEHHHDHDHEHEHSHVPHEHHHHHEHRGLQEVIAIIDATDMSAAAKELALKIFDIIADAEAKAHAVEKNAVHFHEVGAIDSIVDIVAIAVCADSLGVENVIVPELCEGRGTVRCQHGVLPVPVPATANIMQRFGFNVHLLPVQGEFVTPTGAAAAAALMTTDELPQSFKILGIGLGAGKRQYERPSILRALLIEDNAQKKTL